MRRMLAVLSVATLTACAIPLQEARQIAGRTPDWELCYVAISGRGQPNIRQAVYETMQARQTNCNLHADIVRAKMASDAQASAAQGQMGLMLLQAGQARPAAPMRPTTYCRTVSRGTYVETVCD